MTHLQLLHGRLPGPEPVAPRHQPRLAETRPDALQSAGVLGMDGVVGANAGVFQHLVVVR